MVVAMELGAGTRSSLYSNRRVTASPRWTSAAVGPTRSGSMRSVQSPIMHVHPVMEFMASLPEDERVVLVGHSYGGLTISLAMERFPENISVAVFVTALMPNYTSPPATLLQEFRFDRGPENPPTSIFFSPDCLATKLYKHCQPEDVELAKMLVRPNGLFLEDFAKESLLTEEKFGSVDRVFVVCEDDDMFKVKFQRWLIEKSPPKDVKLIEGAGHMVMVSKPKEICLCLQEIAKTYN